MTLAQSPASFSLPNLTSALGDNGLRLLGSFELGPADQWFVGRARQPRSIAPCRQCRLPSMAIFRRRSASQSWADAGPMDRRRDRRHRFGFGPGRRLSLQRSALLSLHPMGQAHGPALFFAHRSHHPSRLRALDRISRQHCFSITRLVMKKRVLTIPARAVRIAPACPPVRSMRLTKRVIVLRPASII